MGMLRFASPSASLGLGVLLRQAGGLRALCLGAAIAAHLIASRVALMESTQVTAKPLTTRFVKRKPRLSKPLEMRKRPRPTQRRIQREMVSVQAKAGRRNASRDWHAGSYARSLAQPRAMVRRVYELRAGVAEPSALASSVQGRMEAENRVDMSLEMVDVNALDTGRYHAMVIQDPTDKREIRGYFHFYRVYATGVLARTVRMNEFPETLINLVKKLDEWTGIRADMGKSIPFSSEEIFKVPFIYFEFGAWGFEARLTPGEANRLGQYMLRGGLYMAEDGGVGIGSGCDKAARATIEDGLAAVGRPKGRFWSFVKIPNDHGIYHCYFDFPDGPPIGADYFNKRYPQCTLKGPYPWLEGVFMDGRLIAIMSNKAYQDVWGRNPWVDVEPTRPFQMGVNIIIFALTQEGSICNRVMDIVDY